MSLRGANEVSKMNVREAPWDEGTVMHALQKPFQRLGARDFWGTVLDAGTNRPLSFEDILGLR